MVHVDAYNITRLMLYRLYHFTLGVIKSSVVVDAMQKVDRADYTSTGMPYADTPNTIGYGQTISAPHMHGQALEDLHQKATIPNAKILDVGSGSGYLSACFARLNPSAKVIGIDCINDLVKQVRI